MHDRGLTHRPAQTDWYRPSTDYLNAMQALFVTQAYQVALAMRDDKVVDTNGAGDFFPIPLACGKTLSISRGLPAHLRASILATRLVCRPWPQINKAHARFDKRHEAPRLVVFRRWASRGDKHGGVR